MSVHSASPASTGVWSRSSGETPLGSWHYTAYRPHSLRGAVDHLWAYRGPTRSVGKRVFPNGCVELLFSPSASYLELPSKTKRSGAWISGPHLRPMLIEQPLHQDCFAARLHPLAARAVFGVPLFELAHRSVFLDELIGRREATSLSERCVNGDHEHRLRWLGTWLEDRLRAATVGERHVRFAVTQIDRSGGAVRIRDVREQLGLSTARLARAFRNHVGLTPKRYARAVRFRTTLSRLSKAPLAPLSRLALDAGYFDQAHMNSEFRSLGGLTPGDYLLEHHPVGDGATASTEL